MAWFNSKVSRVDGSSPRILDSLDKRGDPGGKLTLLNTASIDIVESHIASYEDAKSQLKEVKSTLEGEIAQLQLKLAGTITVIAGVDAALDVVHRGEAVRSKHRNRVQAEAKAESAEDAALLDSVDAAISAELDPGAPFRPK